jgi:hypothetical protein
MEAAVIRYVFKRPLGRAEYPADGRASAAGAPFIYKGDEAFFRHVIHSTFMYGSSQLDENLLLLELLYVKDDACVNDYIPARIHEYLQPVKRPGRGAREIDAI